MGSKDESRENPTDQLIEIGRENAKFFTNANNEGCATICKNGIYHQVLLDSEEFSNYLRILFYHQTSQAPSQEALGRAVGLFKAIAMESGEKYRLTTRVKEANGKFYYNLNNMKKSIVKVTAEDVKIIKTKNPYFLPNRNTATQVKPDFENGDLNLLKKYLRVTHENYFVLLLVYIVTCIIESIPHPILIICGEKGASKSTSSRIIKSIVDPSNSDILSMPTTLESLELILTSNYMPVFDNIDSIRQVESDMFCITSTGGSIIKRKLYTNGDLQIANFKQCLILNGISVVASKADILDRSLLIELERIKDGDLKEERKIWKDFEKDKPRILGGIFNALHKAIPIYEGIALKKMYRMADFTKWGCAIAETLGYGKTVFLEALEQNRTKLNDETISQDVVATAVLAFMKNRKEWSGSVTELFSGLKHIAFEQEIDTHSKVWPKAANVLSRRLNEIKSNLLTMGITITIRHMHAAKMVEMTNKNAENDLDAEFE